MKPSRDCKRIEGLLTGYVHQELDAPGMEKVEEHIRGCESCRQACEELKRSKDLLCSLPVVPAPPDFLLSLRKRLAEDSQTIPGIIHGQPRTILAFLFRRPVPQFALAAIFILVFASAFVLGRYFFPTPHEHVLTGDLLPPSGTGAIHEGMEGPVELVSFDRYKGVAGSQPESAGRGFLQMVSTASPAARTPASSGHEFPSFHTFQTPSELVQALIRNDPQFKNSEIIPIPEGALVHTALNLYQVTISNYAFMRAQRLVMLKGGQLPQNLAMAQRIFNLKIKSLPSPLLPPE